MASRQEVLNVVLAQLLQERGLVAAPEEILKRPTKERRLPDVLIDFQGLRLVIEAEFGAQNSQLAWEKARTRVEEAIAHVGVAVVYPAKLKRVAFERLKSELHHSNLQYAVFTEANEPTGQLLLFKQERKPSFSRGNVDDLGNAIRRSYEQLVRDETLDKAVELLERIIEGFMAALETQPATTDRLAQALGIKELPQHNPRAKRAVNRIAALILANAMIFHEVLSKADARVLPLQQFRGDQALISSMADHWDFILSDINYYPIFKTAFDLIRCVSADETVRRTYENLLKTALDIVGCRASLRHDLAGRIYHRLLEEAKYLGAYYTSIPAATLLLKLAIRSGSKSLESRESTGIPDMRIADLACGTGTLLMAAADALMDSYVRQSAEAGTQPKLKDFHIRLVEKMIYGYDVLPSAIHLTASTLALRVPETPVNVTHLYSMPLGGNERHLGTLDLLEEAVASGTLFGQTEQITGKGTKERVAVSIPALDLCVMNPPFTSSRHGNLLFGSVPDTERRSMQRKLGTVIRQQRLPANVTAGLRAVFVALADRYLKPGGTMALVLPRAMTSGVAWGKTRELIANSYVLRHLIASHQPSHWNFSENTNLSEVLIVASKCDTDQFSNESNVRCINLWRQPKNAIEALTLASMAVGTEAADITASEGPGQLNIGQRKFGEVLQVPWRMMKANLFSLYCSFAQTELIRALQRLRGGDIYLPGQGPVGRITLCRLGDLATLGPDPRDVYDAFDLSTGRTTPYPALWGHDASTVRTMAALPNMYLSPLPVARPGRHLRAATDLWPRAGRVLITQRIRLNTKRLVAVRMARKVLADVWWPLSFLDSIANKPQAEKALVLWLNSTLGLLSMLGHREETEGAWVQYKKPILSELPVLHVGQIGSSALRRLADAYDNLSHEAFDVLPNIENDRPRSAIDNCLIEVFGLPDLSVLREMLACEPILCQSLERLA